MRADASRSAQTWLNSRSPLGFRPVELERKLDDHVRSFPGRTADVDRSAQRFHPVAEADQTRAASSVGATDAVVMDREPEAAVSFGDGNVHAGRARMLRRIGRATRKRRSRPRPRSAPATEPPSRRRARPGSQNGAQAFAGPVQSPPSDRIAGWMPREISRSSSIAPASSSATRPSARRGSSRSGGRVASAARRLRLSDTSRCCVPS
jgi:hypothetical protein